MKAPPPREKAPPPREYDHDWLRKLELTAILGQMSREQRESAERSLWGLALSGGGIRSATFALGVLQALAECKWLGGFHYVSTVSGGGYIGAYLQGLLYRRKGVTGVMAELGESAKRDSSAHASPGDTVRELRGYSNFLTPDKAALSPDRVSLASTYLSNMLLTQVQLVSALLLLAFVPLLMYGAIARLATYPWLTWGLALVATVWAMGVRAHMQDQARLTHCASRPDRYQPPMLLRVASPLLITVAMTLLAALVWGSVGCNAYSPDDGWCRRWAELARDGAKACGLRSWAPNVCRPGPGGALQAIGVASVYLGGFLAWLMWWVRRESRAQSLSSGRLLGQLLVGALATLSMAFLVYAMLAYLGQNGHLLPQLSPLRVDVTPDVDVRPDDRNLEPHLWDVLILGTPLMFLAFFVISLGHIGLTFSTDRDRVTRERWARLMGRCALWVMFGVTLPAALVAFGPWLVHELAGQFGANQATRSDWLLPLLSIAASAVGARAAYVDQTSLGAPKNKWVGRLRGAVIGLAPWAFVLGVLLLSALAAEWLVGHTVDARLRDSPISPLHSQPLHLYLTRLHLVFFAPQWPALLALLLIIALIGLLFAKCIDENEFSMNGFYRNRIVRCYLGPTNPKRRGDPETDLDPDRDDLKLEAMLDQCCRSPSKASTADPDGHRPLYPLISAAANLTATRDLDWQDRKAASFVFSPLFCGHYPLRRPYARPIGDVPPPDSWHDELTPAALHDAVLRNPSALANRTTLGTAVSISGAAVSPNMGYHSSPAVAFLLTLFNARLGWWVENNNVDRGLLGIVGSKLLSELLSRSGDRARYTYVSDGGHFENLGIYELVRRRCSFIMSVDATADPDRDFESLGNAIHKCRVDLGTHIDIDVSLMRPDAQGISRRCAALGKITYPDNSNGFLLYLKPSLLGNESADIAHYASAHSEFPHQSTHDQFFDEHQFEAYRALGHASGRRVLRKTSERLDARVRSSVCGNAPAEIGREERAEPSARPATMPSGNDELGLLDYRRKEALLLELEHWLFEPSNSTSLRFTRHATALSRLLERQARSSALRCLDDQLHPGWLQAGGAGPKHPTPPLPSLAIPAGTVGPNEPHAATPPHLALPDKEDFRDCFYFVQQVIQLMEVVYLDLDLDRNLQHPDNRGWINLFRQWSWVPMFRLTWALSAQTRGSRFVRFCETQLDAPHVVNALRIDWLRDQARVATVEELAHQLHAQDISFIEREILVSPAVRDRCKARRWDVGLLRIDWKRVFGGRPPSLQDELNLGMVIAVSDPVQPLAVSADPTGPLTRLVVARVQDHVRRMGVGAELVYQSVATHRSIKRADITAGDYGPTIGFLSPRTAARQKRELQNMLNRAGRRLGEAGAPASQHSN